MFRLSAINVLLEAFGNTRTIMNANATRFSQIFSVDFDHSGGICSASVQVMSIDNVAENAEEGVIKIRKKGVKFHKGGRLDLQHSLFFVYLLDEA